MIIHIVYFLSMKLNDYIKRNELSVSDAAALFGVSEQSVYKYLSNERLPKADIMERILHATSGLVTPNDFYDLPPAHKGARS